MGGTGGLQGRIDDREAIKRKMRDMSRGEDGFFLEVADICGVMSRPSLLSRLPLTVPKGGGNLTERQERFCQLFAESGRGKESATAVGYADASASYYKLTLNANVMARVMQLRTKRIQGDLSGVALNTLEQVMTDKLCPPAARVSAAKAVLEMAGHGIVAQGLALRHGTDTGSKSLADMNTAELEEFVSRQRAALDALDGVSRSINAPVIDVSEGEMLQITAPQGQFSMEDVADNGDE